MAELRSKLLFELTIDLEEPQIIGDVPHGNRQILSNTGGSFEGPRLRGEVLPHGADWYLTRSDGVGELDVRVTLRTDDGDLIYMKSVGIFRYPQELAGRVLRGEADPAEYYMRDTSAFETASEKYGWLNSIVAVGVGSYRPGRVGMTVYEIE